MFAMKRNDITDRQLAMLAHMHYVSNTLDSIDQVYGRIPPEFIDLADKGLVEIKDVWVVGDKAANITNEGREQLRERGLMAITSALLDMKWLVPLAFYVRMLPRKLLPSFMASDYALVRQAAVIRYRELTDVQSIEA